MVDQSEEGSNSEDMNSKNSSGVTSEEESQVDEQNKKTCADCGTSKTPLWRGGPAGPKSLCNACGIRSRKKRRVILGLEKASTVVKKGKRSNISNSSSSSSSSNNNKISDGLKKRLMELGREVLMQRSTMERQMKKKKLGEEEQAAVLLMALSNGSVYA